MRFEMRWLLLILSGCSLAGASANNNTLVIGAGQEPADIFNPWDTNDLRISKEINNYLTAQLTYLDNKGNIIPEISERAPSLSNGDYKLVTDSRNNVIRNTVTYRIRQDAKWSDGTPITSKDFIFWLRVQNDPRVPVPSRAPWQTARIQSTDPKSFTITYSPAFLFAERVPPRLAPAHIMEAAFNEFDKATAQKRLGNNAQFIASAWGKFISQFTSSARLSTVTSGPFRLKSWRSGQGLWLQRNSNYWRVPPGGTEKYIQTVEYRFIANTNTLQLNMVTGQLDALSPIGLTFDQAMNLKARKDITDKYDVVFVPSGASEQIAIIQKGERAKKLGFDDKRVRQALLYGINRNELTKNLFNNYQRPAHTWINPENDLFKEDVKKYDFNPNKAKQLLSEAGWKPGSDGILVRNGVKMNPRITTTAGNAVRERIERALQEQWRKIGIDLDIINLPAPVLFANDFFKNGDAGRWDLLLFALESDIIEEAGDTYATVEIPTRMNSLTGTNVQKYSNPAYDDLYNRAKRTFNPLERMALFDKMQGIIAEDVPKLFLYTRADAYARSKDLVNYNFTNLSRYVSWNSYKLGWASRGAQAE